MLKEQRHKQILARLSREEVVSISDLSENLEVSYMTIWRDLVELEERGALQRVRGGAVASGLPAPKTPAAFPAFDPALDPHHERKALIGRYAARELVAPGDNITIEAGTTSSAMLPYLEQDELTILTNGLVSALKAAPLLERATVMCSGGVLIETGAFIGPQAEAFFSKFRVQKAFFSAKGLTLENGFTDPTPLYSQLKHAMKANAERTIMLVDSSKFGVSSLIRVMELEAADVLVTDYGAPEEMVTRLRERGVDVRVVAEGYEG